MNKTFTLAITFLISFFGAFAQSDSSAVDVLSTLDDPLTVQTGPILNAKQLQREKWFYSMDEAIRNPNEVYKLSLKEAKLKSFPSDILRFPNLQILNLSGNKIKSVPDEIQDLKNLQVLVLTNNRLRALPAGMRELQHLNQLYLGRNKIVQMPAWVGGLSKLRKLDLAFNHFTTYEIELLQTRLPKCEITH